MYQSQGHPRSLVRDPSEQWNNYLSISSSVQRIPTPYAIGMLLELALLVRSSVFFFFVSLGRADFWRVFALFLEEEISDCLADGPFIQVFKASHFFKNSNTCRREMCLDFRLPLHSYTRGKSANRALSWEKKWDMHVFSLGDATIKLWYNFLLFEILP